MSRGLRVAVPLEEHVLQEMRGSRGDVGLVA